MAIFSTRAYASAETLAADVYYFESIEDLDFYKLDKSFDDLNSTEKRRLATSLKAYAYAHKLEKTMRLDFSLTDLNSVDFKKKGYYLIDFDKKLVGNTLTTSKNLVIKGGGKEVISLKEEGEVIIPEDPKDDKGLSLDVVFDPGAFDFTGPVRVGLYDSSGNLIEVVILDKDNAYRHTFTNLDPKKKYSVWPLNLEDYYFYIDRISNTFYIKLTGKKEASAIPGEDGKDSDSQTSKPNDGKDQIKDDNHPDDTSNQVDDKEESKLDQIDQIDQIGQRGQSSKVVKKLPQTGLLWLPVPFLIGIGIILMAYGRKNEE